MSAAFSLGDEDYWGTNGAIETCLERLSRLAATTPAVDRGLASWLAGQHELFYTGAVIFLDDILTDARRAGDFIGLLDRATAEFLAGEEFTEIGKQWLRSEAPKLRAHLCRIAGWPGPRAALPPTS